MRRLLLLVLALVGLFWWIRKLLDGLRHPAQRPPRQGGAPDPASQSMVRDRVCNTFLPRARAVTARSGGEQHFFCSERCRQEFLAQVPSSTASDVEGQPRRV